MNKIKTKSIELYGMNSCDTFLRAIKSKACNLVFNNSSESFIKSFYLNADVHENGQVFKKSEKFSSFIMIMRFYYL